MATIYDGVRQLASELGSMGLSDWQTKLTDAIDSGSTGGEILMAVRWNLQQLLQEKKDLPEQIKTQAESFIQQIDATGI